MSNCTISVKLNGQVAQKSVAVPGEDKGRTKHDSIVPFLPLDRPDDTIEILFEKGAGVLFLWYVEILLVRNEAPQGKLLPAPSLDEEPNLDVPVNPQDLMQP